jgi:hypothetical protein
MWIDIGLEKSNLLQSYGFDIVGMQYVKRGRNHPWVLEFEHVRDIAILILRAELAAQRVPNEC